MAIAKGRVQEELVPLWQAAGFRWRLAAGSRQLWFAPNGDEPGAIIVRGPDVPVLVAQGVADLGVVGQDLLREYPDWEVLQVASLPVARCRVVLAGQRPEPPVGPFRVASKYRRITAEYLRQRQWLAEIVPLSGSLELAPLIGLAPYIVDIVETGQTLREHHLVEIETILPSEAQLIANPAHWRSKPEVVAVRDRLTAATTATGTGKEGAHA
ncbi:MAG: ATP phosphoribosyltransferase [Firmicutes bacterium]|nr:ATP phosphoribosyltransferase [Alicyclobacillaceae bacterium]MCL6496584.1 ATP phosphoribosyltransferase [Bacillota bacterium]